MRSHGGVFPPHEPAPFQSLTRDTPSGRIILGLYDTVFNGQAAVIAFFVISGFCIHLPYAAGRAFTARPFLLGRAARILIPTGAYLLALHLPHPADAGFTLLLWSVWCEVIYYALYPLLRMAFARTSVRCVLLCAYVPAAIVTACFAFGPSWHALFDAGRWTWLPGLPCWLLGCLLAERNAAPASQPGISPMRIWSFRFGAWALASVSYLAMLHVHLSFLVSLQFFAGFAYFWLAAEIQWFREHRANRLLEWLGGLTFSLYLIHQLAKSFLESWHPVSGLVGWALEIGFILLLSAVFYALVEAPSHHLGRILSRRGRPRSHDTAKPLSTALPLKEVESGKK